MMEAFDVELGKLEPAYTEIRDFFCNRALLVRAVYLQGQEMTLLHPTYREGFHGFNETA